VLNIKIEIFIRNIIDFVTLIFRGWASNVFGLIFILIYNIKKTEKSLKYLMLFHRLSYSPLFLSPILETIKSKKYDNLDKLISDPPEKEEVASRILVVRWPMIENEEIESKGIIVITFTKTLSYFLKNIDITSLENYFYIVLEPSWAGYCDPDIILWDKFIKNPIYIQSSEVYDRASMGLVSNKFIPISIGASDWVDYRLYSVDDSIKEYDSAYVANTTKIKRVHSYLRALSVIKHKKKINYKAALICASWGGKENEIKKMVKYYDVESICDVYISLSSNDLKKKLSMSKVNVLLSLKEGSNRSLFESMFCNTPVLCLVNNVGVNKSYINEYTGALIWDKYLVDSLLTMKEQWCRFSPRQWAMENISPEITMKKLCQVIVSSSNDSALKNDLIEMKNIYLKVNRPEIEYFDYPSFNKVKFNSTLLNLFVKSSNKPKNNKTLNLELNNLKSQFITFVK